MKTLKINYLLSPDFANYYHPFFFEKGREALIVVPVFYNRYKDRDFYRCGNLVSFSGSDSQVKDFLRTRFYRHSSIVYKVSPSDFFRLLDDPRYNLILPTTCSNLRYFKHYYIIRYHGNR